MADKLREYIYVEPKDYIPKDIYDIYNGKIIQKSTWRMLTFFLKYIVM